MTPKEVLAFIREKDIMAVDLRFMDFPGLWQHFTVPVTAFDQAVFDDGLNFDGSSIRGFQAMLDYFPAAVTYDATGTIAYELATPSVEAYKGRLLTYRRQAIGVS